MPQTGGVAVSSSGHVSHLASSQETMRSHGMTFRARAILASHESSMLVMDDPATSGVIVVPCTMAEGISHVSPNIKWWGTN